MLFFIYASFALEWTFSHTSNNKDKDKEEEDEINKHSDDGTDTNNVSVMKEAKSEVALRLLVVCEDLKYFTTRGRRILFIGITNERNWWQRPLPVLPNVCQGFWQLAWPGGSPYQAWAFARCAFRWFKGFKCNSATIIPWGLQRLVCICKLPSDRQEYGQNPVTIHTHV